jgi:hypothetical protein
MNNNEILNKNCKKSFEGEDLNIYTEQKPILNDNHEKSLSNIIYNIESIFLIN